MSDCFVKDCFTIDYGISGNKRMEQYRKAEGKRKQWSQRIFCLDCVYYKECKGREFPNCREAREFFETIKI